MPYTIAEDGPEKTPFCVYKADAEGNPTGETLGCHETQEQAGAQIGAVEQAEAEQASAAPATQPPRAFYMRAYMQRAEGDKPAAEPGSPLRFVASTEGKKRDGLDLKAEDWQIENYRRNPIVLWAHDYSGARLPIGRATVRIEDKKMLADVTFDQGDEFARQVEDKYRRGFLNAVSVGWDDNPDETRDLLDISAVPVPADPNALLLRQRTALSELSRAIDSAVEGGVETRSQGDVENARAGAKMSTRELERFREALDILQELYKAQQKPSEGQSEAYLEALTRIRDGLAKIGE
jgi:hypothetical protein